MVSTLFFKNLFYKNTEAEICEILRMFYELNPRLDFEKYIILCVENLKMQCNFNMFLTKPYKILPFL